MGVCIEFTTRDLTVAALDGSLRECPPIARFGSPYDSTNRVESEFLSVVSTPWTTRQTIEWAVLRYDELLRKLAD